MRLPSDEDIQLVAIEAEDVSTFSEECTPTVAAAIPHAARKVIELLQTSPGDAPK
jgi:Ni,Fe-hydrogenase maturation factor